MKTSHDSLSAEDCEQITAHGLSVAQVEAQLERFRKGFPPIELDRPCRIGDGILQIDPKDHERLIALHDEAAAAGRMTKFVPASGAASRMFRDLLAYYRSDPAPRELPPELIRFFTLIHSFAFYDRLKATMAEHGQDIDSVLAAQGYHQILKFLLTADGLDYAHTPKALIPFHKDSAATRTALAEHMIEATDYIKDRRHICRLHFTIAPQFTAAIRAEVAQVQAEFDSKDIRFEVAYSGQASSSDTIAVDLGNHPFRDTRGRLLFRPGGHGALLYNLNSLAGDIVFIKNIDNVVPSSHRPEQVLYKKILGGLLIQTQQQIFQMIAGLADGNNSTDFHHEVIRFLEAELGVFITDAIRQQEASAQAESLRALLQRPIRVCGIVKNIGEPGGGPFWIRSGKGVVSKQLVESVQVRSADAEQQQILAAATHFNPVDLVCGLRDHEGNLFDLTAYQDPEMGIITGKSYHGRELKALEWPGLWNGGMSKWITLFVEVPLETFAPVKTVNDLLRKDFRKRAS